jgi:hypothetical protein
MRNILKLVTAHLCVIKCDNVQGRESGHASPWVQSNEGYRMIRLVQTLEALE